MSLLRRKPYSGPRPKPLEPAERARLKSWERGMVRFYALAMIALTAAIVAVGLWGDSTAVRRAVLIAILGLVLAATWVQFRECCPRCGTRLGRQSRLLLPPKCRHCGVKFEE